MPTLPSTYGIYVEWLTTLCMVFSVTYYLEPIRKVITSWSRFHSLFKNMIYNINEIAWWKVMYAAYNFEYVNDTKCYKWCTFIHTWSSLNSSCLPCVIASAWRFFSSKSLQWLSHLVHVVLLFSKDILFFQTIKLVRVDFFYWVILNSWVHAHLPYFGLLKH